ncbi:Transposase [Anaerohalosphaera lusitana]|uniref:Transposase n=2 Tax=Anaerohalosphaera lusitana TaxID=1936003 RepID=A0A1U9NNJ7_9BACT|nr:Transposase [Anaerohalosphaera lusitana]AQT69314.1 Transposase [Anaerohalosphaera lusitana]
MALSYYPTMINKYKKRSKISEAKFRQIVKLFALDIEATKIAELTGLSRKTINTILYKIRIRIAEYCQQQSPFDVGEIEIDESYFGARRVRGVRGRGAKGKHIVFGLIKRGGKVYTQVVRNCSKSTLMPIIKQKVDKDSIVYTDGFKTYDGLVDFGYKKHYRVKHGENEFAEGHNHINGIENFWAIAKGRLNKFRGISKGTFALHLKECEFRFNHRHDNLYKLLLKILRKNPI